MKFLKFSMSIIIVLSISFICYVFWSDYYSKNTVRPTLTKETYSEQVKSKLLKFQKPVRVEVIDYIRNRESKFASEIEKIKKIKIPLNAESKHYIQIQFFADETDKNAPLIAQFLFLDIASNNMIQEESIRLE